MGETPPTSAAHRQRGCHVLGSRAGPTLVNISGSLRRHLARFERVRWGPEPVYSVRPAHRLENRASVGTRARTHFGTRFSPESYFFPPETFARHISTFSFFFSVLRVRASWRLANDNTHGFPLKLAAILVLSATLMLSALRVMRWSRTAPHACHQREFRPFYLFFVTQDKSRACPNANRDGVTMPYSLL